MMQSEGLVTCCLSFVMLEEEMMLAGEDLEALTVCPGGKRLGVRV